MENQYEFVNSPSHYNVYSKEAWVMMLELWGEEAFISHCEMTAFKYRMRMGEKPGQSIERDLEKARWYENKALEVKSKSKVKVEKNIFFEENKVEENTFFEEISESSKKDCETTELKKNSLEDLNILSESKKNLILSIVKENPDVVFGGSICLNALGLLNRPIKDIDIIISTGFIKFLRNAIPNISLEESFGFSESVTKLNGEEIQRMGVKFNNEKICIFKTSESQLRFQKVKFYDTYINVQSPLYALLAKKAYEDKTDKHKKDLIEVEKNLFKLLK